MSAQWQDLLRDALQREFGERLPTVTLATVARDGSPHARMVVCRHIAPEGMHIFSSDARSEKNQEVRNRIDAEIVYWLPSQRMQFRLKGITVIGSLIEMAERRAA